MRRGWKTVMFLGLAALLAFTAVDSAQLRAVKVACTSKPVLDNLAIFVGMHIKFFEEAGMKVEPSYFRGGGEVIRAMYVQPEKAPVPRKPVAAGTKAG